MSSVDSNEKTSMHFKNDNSINMIGNDTDEIIQELYYSLLHRYQKSLEQTTQVSNFIFNYDSGMNYLCNKIDINCGGSYIDSPRWLEN